MRIFALLTVCFSASSLAVDEAYWLWAGVPTTLAPKNATLYIYQGNCRQGENLVFEKKGVYPFPIGAKGVFLVYRIIGPLVHSKGLASLFDSHRTQWGKHAVKVVGIQVDFDSPSTRLTDYVRFLKELRKNLPQGQKLSITGLSDWAVSASKASFSELAESVDEVVFQMYQATRNFDNANTYVDALESKGLPFQIGLIAGQKHSLDFRRYPHLTSVVYFIQRKS